MLDLSQSSVQLVQPQLDELGVQTMVLSMITKVLGSAISSVNSLSLERESRRIPWGTYFALRLLAPLGFALWVKESFQWSEAELRLLMKMKFSAEEEDLAAIKARYGDDIFLSKYLSRIRFFLDHALRLEQSSHSPRGRLFRQVRIIKLIRAKDQANRAAELSHLIRRLGALADALAAGFHGQGEERGELLRQRE